MISANSHMMFYTGDVRDQATEDDLEDAIKEIEWDVALELRGTNLHMFRVIKVRGEHEHPA